jgi:hypothetical protein
MAAKPVALNKYCETTLKYPQSFIYKAFGICYAIHRKSKHYE